MGMPDLVSEVDLFTWTMFSAVVLSGDCWTAEDAMPVTTVFTLRMSALLAAPLVSAVQDSIGTVVTTPLYA